MSRYIDADKLTEEFVTLEQFARMRVYDTPTNSPAYERYSTQYHEREKALSIVKAQPTADVVPRATIEQIFADIEKIISAGIEKDESFREKMHSATDRSYFEGGANSQRKLLWLARKLKKKYTEISKEITEEEK
jgi:hypothetical protein